MQSLGVVRVVAWIAMCVVFRNAIRLRANDNFDASASGVTPRSGFGMGGATTIGSIGTAWPSAIDISSDCVRSVLDISAAKRERVNPSFLGVFRFGDERFVRHRS